MQLSETIRTLSDPASFGERGPVEVIQTHISVVFVVCQHAYKLKKPVRFEFLDFSTLAARERACHEELRLNRRLARNIYLDVVPLVELPAGELRVGQDYTGKGQVVDYLVKMQRLPLEQCLDRLIESKQVNLHQTDAIAKLLADFYAKAAPIAIGRAEYRRHIEHHVRANRSDLLAAGEQLDAMSVRRVHAAQLSYLQLGAADFDARVAAGRIVDGHGDLRPEHICLTDPPVVFDCIEFSAEFRQIDSADELAFLQMECEAAGAAEVGQTVNAAFVRATGDVCPAALSHFYIAYRACVRAKVAALRARQLDKQTGDPDKLQRLQAQAAWRQAAKYIEIAAAHADLFARPVLIVIGGLMGSGKSTLARHLAETFGAELLQTDVLRQELFGNEPSHAEFGQIIYRPERKAEVYRELFARAGSLIAHAQSVVLDGAFLTSALRREALALAASGYHNVLVDCHCSADVARQRIARRLARGGDASEARPELYTQQQKQAEPLAADLHALVVDTAQAIDEQVESVCRRLAGG